MATAARPTTSQELWQQGMDDYGPQLPLLLHPGENPRGVAFVDFGRLVKDPPWYYVTPPDGVFWTTLFVLARMVSPLDPHPIKRIQRTLPSQQPMSGGWKSGAGRLRIAAEGNGPSLRDLLMIVTDHRVIVLDGSFDTELLKRRRVAEYRRDELRLRPGPARAPGAGVDLGFPDGSWIRMGGDPLRDELLTWLLSG
jgi:hypothetical protein